MIDFIHWTKHKLCNTCFGVNYSNCSFQSFPSFQYINCLKRTVKIRPFSELQYEDKNWNNLVLLFFSLWHKFYFSSAPNKCLPPSSQYWQSRKKWREALTIKLMSSRNLQIEFKLDLLLMTAQMFRGIKDTGACKPIMKLCFTNHVHVKYKHMETWTQKFIDFLCNIKRAKLKVESTEHQGAQNSLFTMDDFFLFS